ncbi:MAG TPA: Fe-S cluster assembly protein SufB, partial [Spirochaetales bacterium]|nr:Fe-S cluster assembly protein SufB [Spirochaetales bacterium]
MSAPVSAGSVGANPAPVAASPVPGAGVAAAEDVAGSAPADPGIGEYRFGFSYPDKSVFRTRKGLDEEVVRAISALKEEPDWMLAIRLRALAAFGKKPMPAWGADLSDIDFDEIVYYARPQDRPKGSWDELPEEIRETYRRIGVPEAERKFLAGVGAQYDSEIVYHSIRADLEKKGVIFCSPEVAVKEHPDLVRKYFGTVIPHNDNKFAALNTAVWSGGSFVYVPNGVKVDIPLQAYFRINSERFGQFERTLIIADEGSFVHYIEGCTAPVYATDSLHSAVVEIIALPGSRVRYSTIQNWSSDVYNLVTKRAVAHAGAT